MQTKIENITPAMAAEWLNNNPANRRRKDKRIQTYARAMKAGRWRLTHQGIALDKDGALMDGQNRLAAIVEAGVSVKMMVARNCDRENMLAIDAGCPRNVGDMLTISHGVTQGLWRCAVLRVLLPIQHGNYSYLPDEYELAEACETHQAAFDWLLAIPGYTLFKYAPHAAALIYAYEKHPKLIDKFAQLVISQENQTLGSPVLATRNAIQSRKPAYSGNVARFREFRIICRGAMAFCYGEKLSRIMDTDQGVAYFAQKGATP